nr:MAG TPA: hypothetical protein [Caudoviricetes sp.]
MWILSSSALMLCMIRRLRRALCAPRELRSENLFELLSLLLFMHNCLVFIYKI